MALGLGLLWGGGGSFPMKSLLEGVQGVLIRSLSSQSGGRDGVKFR